MGISIRKSISWPPEPHNEPTSTVVLTSPGHWFVDVRVLLSASTSSTIATTAGDTASLEWAFAGRSSSSGAQSVWRHWVDSRTENAGSVIDEGVCEHMPNGNMLERGQMAHPSTGEMAPYEEIWIDIRPISTEESGPPCCVVLQLCDDKAGIRGVVERLGQFCQGVVRSAAEGVTVERWEWKEKGGWQRTYRIGRGSVPCEQVAKCAQLLKEGAVLEDGGYSWTVLEAAVVDDGGHR